MSDMAREDSNSCGAEDQVSGTGPTPTPLPWWALAGRDRRRLTPRRLLIAGVLIFLSGLLTWINYPFLPDYKILLFNRPTTNLSSTSLPGQWSMNGRDHAQRRFVSSLSQQPAGRVLWSQDLGESTFSAPVVVDGVV